MARKGTKRLLVVLGVVVVLAGLWFAALKLSGISGRAAAGAGGRTYEEEIIDEGPSQDKIVMINVVGEIFSDPQGTASGASDSNIIAQLNKAESDPDVKGIIVNLETPGGGVLASDAIYTKIRQIRRDTPVVALMGEVAASGGYYIAAAANEIVAHPYTWTGSIGVIAQIPNFEQTAGKLGVRMTVIKSGALKDIGSPFRAMTEQERALFQTLIDEAYNGFVDIVAKGRNLTPERTRQLADGRIYSGRQARDLGLVDYLGSRDRAFSRAKTLGRSPGASLVMYRPSESLLQKLNPFASAKSPAQQISDTLGLTRKPGAAYLWIP